MHDLGEDLLASVLALARQLPRSALAGLPASASQPASVMMTAAQAPTQRNALLLRRREDGWSPSACALVCRAWRRAWLAALALQRSKVGRRPRGCCCRRQALCSRVWQPTNMIAATR